MKKHQIGILVGIFFMTSIELLFGQDGQAGQQIFTNDGAWCWFQDPRAIYVNVQYERTYAQWMTKSGQLQVGAFDHKGSTIQKYTLKEDWDTDDHNVGAFLLLPDNRIMVFYARHNQQGIFCRTTSNPEDITSWKEEITISNTSRITYAHPVYLQDERLFYVFWRGPSWKPTFSTSKDGKTWSDAVVLLQDNTNAGNKVRPYTKITSDGNSSIHFAFTDGHPNVEPQNSIYYMKYEDSNFYKANGDLIGAMDSLPIQHTNSDIVYNGNFTSIRSWIWDIALDNQGDPVIVYTRLPKPTNHRYHYTRWNGEEWIDQQLSTGGKWFPQTPEGVEEREQQYSGGIALNRANPSELYLSKQKKRFFEIEKWSSEDEGKTWKKTKITKNSSFLNVRPVVPRTYNGNKDIVLWMFGEYVHYTNYDTGIMLLEMEK